MLRKVIAFTIMVCTIFSFTACKKDSSANPTNKPTATAGLAASTTMNNTPSGDIFSTQGSTETDDNSTVLQTPEPTVSNSPTTTMSNDTKNPVSTKAPSTSKPTVTGTTDSKSKSLQIFDLGFDSMLLTGNNKLICGKKGSYYGATNLKGEVVIPFEYDSILSPTEDGYIVAWKYMNKTVNNVEVEVTDSYFFNLSGKLLYKSQSEGSSKIDKFGDEYYSASGETIVHYNYGVLLTKTNFKKISDRSIYTLNMRRTDGSLIKSFDNIIGFCQYPDGALVMTNAKIIEDFYYWIEESDFIFVDKTGKILDTYTDGSEGHVIGFSSWAKGASGNYVSVYGTWYESNYIMSKDFDTKYEYNSNVANYVDHYGTKVIFENDDESYSLVDITKVPQNTLSSVKDGVISKYKYDSMAFNSAFGSSVEYALVSRDGKWGYLSLDGKIEKLYDDAGYLYNGKGIVKIGNEIYVINSKFEKISDSITGYDSVSTIGENLYTVKKSGKTYLAIYTP